MSALAAPALPAAGQAAPAPVRLRRVCDYQLSGLPCINEHAHTGGGRGCVHASTSGVPDRHDYGDDE